ncbi:MAG TPA: bifunctional hydroxymethylpyrimidine kinase/phosphomethylpyrimidine kinase [Candidatus Eisenbacteria bacterium]|nr:bifunctional hydroxymethylpyrimidine kinase/phosphomethylpyrimidine kinase [Candidatus Eisenbacteria bacterium]
MSTRVPIRKALTIAGSDSGAGAGIQADLKTFAALGVYGTSAVTAVTAQNTVGVLRAVALSPAIVAAQIDAVVRDIGTDAVKTGMLANAEIIVAVAERIRAHGLPRLVIDPVMVAKSGDRLLRRDAIDALRRRLIPLATVVTPNLPEAEALTGLELKNAAAIREAARRIVAMGARSALIKGGHRRGPAIDLLYDGKGFYELRAARVRTRHTHGTGCTFSAAIAAHLAKGETLLAAARHAKRFITAALRGGFAIGAGHGPVHHFYALWRPPKH